jgi:hypothetical protein
MGGNVEVFNHFNVTLKLFSNSRFHFIFQSGAFLFKSSIDNEQFTFHHRDVALSPKDPDATIQWSSERETAA